MATFKLDIKDANGTFRKLFGFLRGGTTDEIVSATVPVDSNGNEIPFAKNQNVINYTAISSGFGYGTGNLLVLFQFYDDKTDAVTLKWYNSTTNTILTSAPNVAHIELIKTQISNFPVNQIVSGTITEASAAATKTAVEGLNTNLGGKADVEATSDTGSFSEIALTKRQLTRLSLLLGSSDAILSNTGTTNTSIATLNGKIDTLNGKIDLLNAAATANITANTLLIKHMRMNELLLANLLGKGFDFDEIQKTINTDSNF